MPLFQPQFSLEQLESRRLLSTVLTVDVSQGGFALLVQGTAGNDTINVSQQSSGDILVNVNGVTEYNGAPPTAEVGRIVIFGDDGNDDIAIATNVDYFAHIHGGNGADRIRGGSRADVLIGSEGDDLIHGHDGRDLLIGGNGADRIIGHPDDDILIAGTTIYDDEGIGFTNQPNAVDLMREWNRNAGNTMPGMTAQDDYNERVIHITTEGGAGGNNAFSWLNDGSTGTQTVFDDGAEDKITGSSGFDLFFFNADQDKAADIHDEEFAFDMEFLTQA
jgi:Ca2+-binding RTX toxin-like protein